MSFLESVRIALRALTANKLRSVLTMLGIIIGVGAVIALMSAGEGVSAYVEEQFRGFGSNLLFVVAGGQDQAFSGQPGTVVGGAELTNEDVEALRDPVRAPDVVAVSPVVMQTTLVATAKEEKVTQIEGVAPDYASVRKWFPVAGEFIRQTDIEARSRVAVLGQDVAEELFPENPYPLGETVKINDVLFRVIGIMEKKGGSSFGSQDDAVFVPLTTMQTRLVSMRSQSGDYQVSQIVVEAASKDRIDAASQQVATILRDQHGIDFTDEDDFTILSQEDIISVFGNITNVLTTFLGAIAGISLLVGGIGIMNIMLVSVTERTREIGLRKAVGARRSDILWQFLLEAMTLSVVGGLVGIGLGAMGASIISSLIEGFEALVTPQAVILATTFSAAVGLIFGVYPARRASLLNPIEALRYE
ncbi:MAG: ABC transporter permease [Anaerolineae bacterium]|nr:ABC transporter permease [Anaerolineae bacterium]